jgi:hypothetical protein
MVKSHTIRKGTARDILASCLPNTSFYGYLTKQQRRTVDDVIAAIQAGARCNLSLLATEIKSMYKIPHSVNSIRQWMRSRIGDVK